MNPLIQINFKSDQTPRDIYTIFINELKQSIRLNACDPEKLKEIRLELLECVAIVDHLQFSSKTKGGF